jgi:hypothetical protein
MKSDLPVLLSKPLLGIARQVHRSIIEDHVDLLARIVSDDLTSSVGENQGSRESATKN